MSRVRDIANILSGGSSAIATDAEIPSYIAGKNFVINGGFDFWQRGTSFAGLGAATSSTYTADRWNSGAAANITISRVSAITEGLQYGLRIQRNSGTSTGGDAFICHTIESSNATLLAGKTVTLSFNVRTGANFSGAAAYCVPRFGTGTDEGSALGYNGQWTGHNQLVHTVSPNTTMTNYTKTFTVPSGTKEIMLLMGVQSFAATSAGANDWLEFEKIQLEIGSVATPFSRAGGDIQGELTKCQRYFETGIGYYNAYTNLGNNYPVAPMVGTNFNTQKRVAPSIGLGSNTAVTGYTNAGNTYNINVNSFAQNFLSLANGSFAFVSIFQPWTASSEL
jgi:hypothetical protein